MTNNEMAEFSCLHDKFEGLMRKIVSSAGRMLI
jgi:hypothetical protein